MKECPVCGRCSDDAADACPEEGARLRPTLAGPPLLDRKYRLIERLGAGGMGAVYRAEHLGLRRLFAVKVLHTPLAGNPEFRRRFENEARTLGRLRHPGIVEVTDFGVDAERGIPYLVMEPLAAVGLDDLLRRTGALPPRAALGLLRQVADALDAAHAAGVLHRDLKAGNVLVLDGDLRQARVRVVDFGLASFHETPGPAAAASAAAPGAPAAADGGAADAEDGDLLGTPTYMAPEVWRGEEPGPPADVWAFGVLAFLLLVGRMPFPGPWLAAIGEQVERGAPRPSSLRPELPAALDAPLLSALRPDPDARPARAADFVAALESALLGVERGAWRRRELPRRSAAALGLGLLAALACGPLAGRLAAVEDRLLDARFRLAASRPARREPLLLVLDEATLRSDPAPLVGKAEEVGTLLGRALDAGARGAAIDLLLPRSWGSSPAFARLVLRHADRLALAFSSTEEGRVVGPEVVEGLLAATLGPRRSGELFGFVEVPEDGDGVVRRFRPLLPDADGALRPSLAARAARLLVPRLPLPRGTVWLDARVDWGTYERISWRDLEGTLARQPQRFRGRLLFLGGDFAASGDSAFRVPRRAGMPETLPGVTLQALLLQTLLDGVPLRNASPAAALPLGGLAVALAAAGPLLGRRRAAWGAGPLLAVLWLLAGFALFRLAATVVQLAAPVLCILMSWTLAWIARSRLAPEP